MKAIKFLVAAMAMAFAMSANAKIFENNHFTVDANVGASVYPTVVMTSPWSFKSSTESEAAFGLGATFQTEILSTKWITLDWDVFRIAWIAPFNSPGDWDELHFKTGARAYSPTFAGDHLRGYTNLDMGYVLGIYGGDEVDTSSAFGLDWGIGIQLNKKFSFGYTLQYETYAESKNHFFTFGYTF